jgi:hypothetical protein
MIAEPGPSEPVETVTVLYKYERERESERERDWETAQKEVFLSLSQFFLLQYDSHEFWQQIHLLFGCEERSLSDQLPIGRLCDHRGHSDWTDNGNTADYSGWGVGKKERETKRERGRERQGEAGRGQRDGTGRQAETEQETD